MIHSIPYQNQNAGNMEADIMVRHIMKIETEAKSIQLSKRVFFGDEHKVGKGAVPVSNTAK